MRPGFVYIFEAENGTVKVGFSTNVTARLRTLLLHSPLRVRLIAKWAGWVSDEILIHRMLEGSRLHTEWFLPTSETLIFVESKRGLGVDVIEPWSIEVAETRAERAARTKAQRSASMKAAWVKARKEPDRHGGLCWRTTKVAWLRAQAGQAA